MAGFLDDYGAGDERRARNIKIVVVSVAGLAILTGLLYYFFHNYRQEQQVKRFFQLLATHDYQGAYGMWTTSDAERKAYPMSSFLEDWGPPADVGGFTVLDADSCDNSVIVDVDAGRAGDRKVWVDRDTLGLSFPPNDRGCVRALVDQSGNLFYQDKHNRIHEWFRDLKYRLHGRTYK